MMNRDWYLERIAKSLEKLAKQHCGDDEPVVPEERTEPESRIDIIREMPSGKLADLISKRVNCDRCPIIHYCMLNNSCRDSWLKFLEDKPENPNDIFAKKED
jgi:hypothetical protein